MIIIFPMKLFAFLGFFQEHCHLENASQRKIHVSIFLTVKASTNVSSYLTINCAKFESYFRIWKDIVMTLKTSHETNNSRDIFKRWVEGKICVESPRFQINRHMESWWWLVLRKTRVFPTLCHSKLLFIMPLALW